MNQPKASKYEIDWHPDRVTAFWSKVDRRDVAGCWEWQGERHAFGYGLYVEWSDNRRSLRLYAHRISLLLSGVELKGVVRHDCDNPPCVNPSHLRVGTQGQNIQDAISRDRMDMSGLAIGQARTWPPRPCRRCGTEVRQGRKRYCPPCRKVVTRESHERHRAKVKAARAGFSERERRAMKKAAA